jgi:asparagine synthase (glutamine-hydrolysing)
MCGIVGLVHAHGAPVAREDVIAMRDRLTHRGPDDAGLRVVGPVGFGSRRLSIFDLTPAGNQPMVTDDGRLWIVFNGAIYNHVELAAELRSMGHRFVSRSDTEVLLHMYAQYGKTCVHRLNGMFAFAIWDAYERTLFAARDRLGIKPFVYRHTPARFAFASEAKALVETEPRGPSPDHTAIADFLFAGAPLGTKSGFAGIQQLEPGHWLTWREGKLEVHRYWDIAYHYDGRREADLLADLAWLVDDAVRLHSRGDVAVGSHLSGGLDSSAVASLASRHVASLKTFAIRFAGGAYYDEGDHARVVADHIKACHVDAVPDPGTLVDLLPAMIYHMDAPLPTWGAFGYIAISQLARRHVKVSLTGHGGDELFAGYPKHFGTAFGSTDMFDFSTVPALGRSMLQRLRTSWQREGWRGVGRRLRRRFARRPETFEDRWVASHCGLEPAHHPLLQARFARSLDDYSPRDSYLRPMLEAPTSDPLDRCLYHDLRVYLPHLLAMEDRMSMAVSLESRVPLLDHRVVDLTARIPSAFKVSGREPKRLLREVVRPLLPPSILDRRDKRPFPIPVEQWLEASLFDTVRSILRTPRSLDRGIFDPDRLRENDLGLSDLWPILNVELWYRIFIDRDPVWVERAAALRTPAAAGVT